MDTNAAEVGERGAADDAPIPDKEEGERGEGAAWELCASDDVRGETGVAAALWPDFCWSCPLQSHWYTCPEVVTANIWCRPSAAPATEAAARAAPDDPVASALPDLCMPTTRRNFLSVRAEVALLRCTTRLDACAAEALRPSPCPGTGDSAREAGPLRERLACVMASIVPRPIEVVAPDALLMLPARNRPSSVRASPPVRPATAACSSAVTSTAGPFSDRPMWFQLNRWPPSVDNAKHSVHQSHMGE